MAIITLNNNSLSSVTALPAGVGGKVLQVVQGSTTTTTTLTSQTWTDTTLSASITPSSTSNKIIILVNQMFNIYRPSVADAGGSIRLLRDSTVVYGGDIAYQLYSEAGSANAINFYDYTSLSYLDSPSSTSSLTYKTQQRSYDVEDRTTTQSGSSKSTITLMEIAG